ncbi:hypothetical protein BC830DRAFT_670104 [Chytriomyces sp. MP71]|nr:hypothetical protein BC830DRAFT_670104 [Chytriomyces sp. MP71]
MWSLYNRYHDKYVENRQKEEKKWVYQNQVCLSDLGFIASKARLGDKHHGFDGFDNTSSISNSMSSGSYDSARRTPVRQDSSISSNGSSRPHSEAYEGVRDLNTKLWKRAKATPIGPAVSRDEHLRQLYDESVDCLFRHHVAHHAPLKGAAAEEIETHLQGNNVEFPHPRLRMTRTEMQYLLGKNGVSMEGLIPFLTPEDQMNILKAKEKQLLLRRWRETWNAVRPPKPGWHEIRGPGFANEARRARQLLVSPELQRASQQTRLAILELWRTEVTDRILFHDPVNPQYSLQNSGLAEFARMESAALHAPMHGRLTDVALAPWSGTAMKRATKMVSSSVSSAE